jgi:hypothetical protein
MMCKICDIGAGWGILILGVAFLLKDYGVFGFRADVISVLLVLVGIAKIMCGNCRSCLVQYSKKK